MAFSSDDAKKELENLKQQAKERQDISTSMEGYLDGLKRAKALNETIHDNNRIALEIEAKIKQAIADSDFETALNQTKTLQVLQEQTKVFKENLGLLGKQLKEVNKMNLLMSKGAASAVKMIGNLPGIYKQGVAKLESLGLTKMDKALKESALSMGILSNQTDSFRETIKQASINTNMIGFGLEENAKMQSDYSDALGRTVLMSQQGLESMAAMAKASGLGAEGSAKMAADMDNQGYSAERTAGFMEQTFNDSRKMGVNASKVMKAMAANMKLVNKYNFKGGVKGLAKMAETTTKLGVDMNFVTGMADKLFDIEGAIDMSAQLQVMGGAWAKLADPFKLMYMARNDMAGLTEEIGKAAESSVTFDKSTGEFKISAMEMHKLRKVAEQTGIAYEDLATAGKNARKATEVKKQLGYKFDKETQEFIANTATFNEKGQATIMLDGKPKLLNTLTAADQTALKTQITQKASFKEMAQQSMGFDEQLTGLISSLKVAALPLIETLNKELIPKIQAAFEQMKKEGWFEKIGEVAKMVGSFIGSIAGFALEFPKLTAGLIVFSKVGGFLFQKASWFMNGITLAKGFQAGSGGMGGGMGNALNLSKGNLLKAGGLGLAGAAVGMGTDYLVENQRKKGNEKTADAINVGGSAASGALTGAAIGSLIPVVGTAIGAIAGGLIGGGMALYQNSQSQAQNDAFFTSPIHDGMIPKITKNLGNDFSKRRAVMQGGKVTPIDNKDDLLAMKKGGAIDKVLNTSTQPNVMRHEFGDIDISGTITLSMPGGQQMSVQLMHDEQFKRNITKMIHSQTEMALSGGKNKA